MHLKIEKAAGIFLVLVVWVLAGGAPARAVGAAGDGQGRLTQITAIEEADDGGSRIIVVRGNGLFGRHNAWIYTNPPKIVVDIPGAVPPFDSMVRKVSHPAVESIRVGYHPEAVRVVLDIRGRDIPMFRTAVRGSELTIVLEAAGEATESGRPVHSEAAASGPANSGGAATADAVDGQPVDAGGTGRTAAVEHAADDLFDAQERMVDRSRLGATKADQLLADGIDAFTAGNFSEAVALLDRFVAGGARGPAAEQAVFLAARAFDRLHADEVDSHYNAVKRRYEDAIYRYADAIYLPEAYYAVADLCFRGNMHAEALGYCNLVIGMGKREMATLRAMLLKARVLSVTGRQQEALTIYQQVYQQHPDLAVGLTAKIETAKALFDLNRFDRSLELLASVAKDRDNLIRYPELSRYLGNNLYQLGDFSGAREHLFRAYNMAPFDADSPLILARIADAYKEEGQPRAAEKVYRLVQERHPETEGAMIAMYRMAELQENGAAAPGESGPRTSADKPGGADGTRKIYEEVVKKTAAVETASPLAAYALLKLAVLDYKEGRCTSSLNRLKHLLESYPSTGLRREIAKTFEDSLACVLEEDYRAKKYKRIVNTYHTQKKAVDGLTSPAVFLVVARSAANLGLDTLAAEMYAAAEAHLYGQQKPADLLYYLALDAQAKDDPQAALAYADRLLARHPDSGLSAETCLLKGDLLRVDANHRQAAAMYDKAADRMKDPCRRSAALLKGAGAYFKAGSENEAVRRLREAQAAAKNCDGSDASVWGEIGMLFIEYGFPEEALAAFQTALAKDDSAAVAPRLKIMAARCHEMLEDSESYLAIYGEVAAQNDPFWGRIAREKMAEYDFKTLVAKEK